MEILIESANTLFEKGLPSRPTGLPEPINTHSSLTLQNSVAFRQSEEAQVAEFDPQWSRHSTITSISSSSISCPPMSPSSSSAASSGSPMPRRTPVLSELPNFNFSALHLYAGAAEQQEMQQDRVSVADARDTVALRERGLTQNQSQVFLPSRLAPVPEQPEERKRQLEASLAYMPMSPQTISSYDPCTTVASMMSPPTLGGVPFSP
jgi:hypothetical protein